MLPVLRTITCLLAVKVGGEEGGVVGVGDDLGLDGLDVGGVGRRRRLLGRLGARLQEAAVGQLQHRVATPGAAAVASTGRRRVQGERAVRQIAGGLLLLLLLLWGRRDDGAERRRAPWELAVVLSVGGGSQPEVVADLLHGLSLVM